MIHGKIMAIVAGAVVLGASLAAAGAAYASAPGSQPALARYMQQHIHWKKCQLGPDDTLGKRLDEGGSQCANVTVPLDYAHPDGRTITVAMSRLPASDKAHRIGTMMLNSGGPAAIAMDMPLDWRTLMKTAGTRYDLIGMDPRFVGRSTPLDCHWPTGSMMRGPGPDRTSFDRAARFERGLADKCRRQHGGVLPFVTTRNTARDMDVIRAALGEKKISYLGYSYGTYLGAVYTQLFPGHTDRVVLDSALDPTRYGPQMFPDMDASNETALRSWARWVADRNGTYHLGNTRVAVLSTIDSIVKSAAKKPLQVGDFRVSDAIAQTVLFNGLSDDRDAPRASLADAMQPLLKAAEGRTVTPNPDLADTLTFFLTGSESATGSAQAAILCGDVAAPHNRDYYWSAIQRNRANALGPLLNNVTACAFWPRPVETPTQVHNTAPALIVNSTGDTRTPYQGARALHRMMTGSRFLTLRGAAIHAVYANYGNNCVDDKVDSYLLSGQLPTADTACAARH